MRVCHCVGHLTNPGGACCMDMPHNRNISGTWLNPQYLDSQPKEKEPFIMPKSPFTDEEIKALKKLLADRAESEKEPVEHLTPKICGFETYFENGVWNLTLIDENYYGIEHLEFKTLEEVVNKLFTMMQNEK